MARGRFLSTSIATDKRLNSLSVEAELVYLMTVPHLDRDGMILGDPLSLWGEVCRRRPHLMDSMESIIDEWLVCGLVLRFEGNDDPILFFVGFSKNQNGMRYDREAPSEFPCPPGYVRTPTGLRQKVDDPQCAELVRSDAGAMPDVSRSDAGVSPLARGRARLEGEVEVKGEVKDQGEGEGERRNKSAAAESLPPSLVIFRTHCTKPINNTQQDAIASAVTDLRLWEQVLKEWSLRGYNMGNVNGQLDWYANGIPSAHKNGAQHGSGERRHQPNGGDDPPALDPELERKFAERAERRRAEAGP